MSCGPNVVQNHTIKIGNKFFENWTKLKYLETMATSQNCINAEIKSRLKWEVFSTIQFRILFVFDLDDQVKELPDLL
jgi:hypothetical protein